MDVRFRAANAEDFDFVRGLYFETMRSSIERLFGWDQAHQEASFTGWFRLDEASIITANGLDIGWMQQRIERDAIFLGSLYLKPEMQGKGIGSQVLRMLLGRAKDQSMAVTLAVMKINPAIRLYERLGFQITHEDEYKFYMKADPRPQESPYEQGG